VHFISITCLFQHVGSTDVAGDMQGLSPVIPVIHKRAVFRPAELHFVRIIYT